MFVDCITNDPYSGRNDASYISVTSLVAPPQLTWLKRRHFDEIVEDVSMRAWSLFGQAGHAVIERAAQGRTDCLTEVRVYHEFQGWVINGCFDLLDLTSDICWDFKFTSIWAATEEAMKPEWRIQLSLLAWIMRKNGHVVRDGKILAIFRDWSAEKARYEAKKGYPAAPVRVISTELMNHAECEAFVAERLSELASESPRACTDEEIWRRGKEWAVMRGKNKRATRCFEKLEDAEAFIAAAADKTMRLEGREAKAVRCLSYCPVNRFCRQALAENL